MPLSSVDQLHSLNNLHHSTPPNSNIHQFPTSPSSSNLSRKKKVLLISPNDKHNTFLDASRVTTNPPTLPQKDLRQRPLPTDLSLSLSLLPNITQPDPLQDITQKKQQHQQHQQQLTLQNNILQPFVLTQQSQLLKSKTISSSYVNNHLDVSPPLSRLRPSTTASFPTPPPSPVYNFTSFIMPRTSHLHNTTSPQLRLRPQLDNCSIDHLQIQVKTKMDSLPPDNLRCINANHLSTTTTPTTTTITNNNNNDNNNNNNNSNNKFVTSKSMSNFNSDLYSSYQHLSLNINTCNDSITPPPTISQISSATQTISDEFGDAIISPTYSSPKKQISPLKVRRNLQAELDEQVESPIFDQNHLIKSKNNIKKYEKACDATQKAFVDENDDLNRNDYTITSPAIDSQKAINLPKESNSSISGIDLKPLTQSKQQSSQLSIQSKVIPITPQEYIHSPQIKIESVLNVPPVVEDNSRKLSDEKRLLQLKKWKTTAVEQAGYIILQVINEGNFGTVLKAQRQGLEGWVAIKVINKMRLNNKEMDSVRKQAMTLRSLSHRYIVQFYEDFEDEEYFYHVFEYLHGGDLYDRLEARGKPFSEAQALFLARQFLYAVSYLHSRSAAHRDIKLENFVFETNPHDQRQVMKLIDFDLLIVRGKESPKTVMCNDMCGTILYVSPEIASGKEHIPEQSDMWACGVMLYVLLSYQMPFQGETGREILRAVRSKEPHFNPAIWSHISPDTKQLVKDLLSKHGADRPNAQEALERVKSIQSVSKDTINKSKLRTFTQGLRSVSLNIWDPSGSLMRRARPEQRRSSRHQSRRSRSNFPVPDDSNSTSNIRPSTSYRVSEDHSRRQENDNQANVWRYSVGDRQTPVRRKEQPRPAAPIPPFEREERFGSHEFLTSPALGNVLGRKRPTQNGPNPMKTENGNENQRESTMRMSRRLTKVKFGLKVRNWINIGRDGRRGRNAN